MPIPAPKFAMTPTPRMDSNERPSLNEDADIKLLCLRLFALLQRSVLLRQVIPHVQLADLFPCMAAGDALGKLRVRPVHASEQVVRVEKLTLKLDARNVGGQTSALCCNQRADGPVR